MQTYIYGQDNFKMLISPKKNRLNTHLCLAMICLLEACDSSNEPSQEREAPNSYTIPFNYGQESTQSCSQLGCPTIDCSKLTYYEKVGSACLEHIRSSSLDKPCVNSQCIEDPLEYCTNQSTIRHSNNQECLRFEGCIGSIKHELVADEGKLCNAERGVCDENGECISTEMEMMAGAEMMAGTEVMAGRETMAGAENTLTEYCRRLASSANVDLCEVRRSQQSCLFPYDFLLGMGLFFHANCNEFCSDLSGRCTEAYLAREPCEMIDEVSCESLSGGLQVCSCQFN